MRTFHTAFRPYAIYFQLEKSGVGGGRFGSTAEAVASSEEADAFVKGAWSAVQRRNLPSTMNPKRQKEEDHTAEAVASPEDAEGEDAFVEGVRSARGVHAARTTI